MSEQKIAFKTADTFTAEERLGLVHAYRTPTTATFAAPEPRTTRESVTA